MSEERTYTLTEARRVMALNQCASTGHEWSIVQSISGGPHRIICDQCGWGGSVTMGERPTRP